MNVQGWTALMPPGEPTDESSAFGDVLASPEPLPPEPSPEACPPLYEEEDGLPPAVRWSRPRPSRHCSPTPSPPHRRRRRRRRRSRAAAAVQPAAGAAAAR